MKRDTFAVRLAYLRWLEAPSRVAAESDVAFAERAGVTYGWLKKWMKRDDAPDDRNFTRKIVDALRADSDWLLDGKGKPPQPELWKRWVSGEPLHVGKGGRTVDLDESKRRGA